MSVKKFHTFEAEISGRVSEAIVRENKVSAISDEIKALQTKRHQNSHERRDTEEKIRKLQKTLVNDTDCATKYLLDVLPHIKNYSDCMQKLHEEKDKAMYNMGSVYRGYQKDYMRNIDYAIKQKLGNNENCVCCGSTDIILDRVTSTMICPDCGCSNDVLGCGQENASYGHSGPVQTKYAYKRINHFNEWLSSFQAKENTCVEQAIIDQVKGEYKKNRFVKPEDVTTKRTREYLKKLKLNKYYEHTPQITAAISGVTAIRMSSVQERKLRTMFDIIQKPFEDVCPPDRKNFPSYAYIIHKFCELLEYDDIKDHFPMLKSREKLFQLDKIWKEICAQLNWQFIKSI